MLVDSNILVYAINEASPKHEQAKEFIHTHIDNLVVAQQNIIESLRILTHSTFVNPLKTDEAIEAIEGITDALGIICPQDETYFLAKELLQKYQISSNKIFDAYLVATMLSNGIQEIATDNLRDFQQFREIKIINPFIAIQ